MDNSKYIEQLEEIKKMMDRSSRFLSLSGFSGVIIGILALAGAGMARYLIHSQEYGTLVLKKYLFLIAAGVLILSLLTAWFLTERKARQKNESIWSGVGLRLLINLAVPLLTGGLFSLALFQYQLFFLIPGTMLCFYGLGLINVSKFTFDELRQLGYTELLLGIIAIFIPSLNLILWAAGFGILHIVYGIYMQVKYGK